METRTYFLCSQYSPMCKNILDSLSELQIPLDDLHLLCIDHPSIREYINQSDITTVPTLVVHNIQNQSNQFLEGDDCIAYINAYIQQYRSIQEKLQIDKHKQEKQAQLDLHLENERHQAQQAQLQSQLQQLQQQNQQLSQTQSEILQQHLEPSVQAQQQLAKQDQFEQQQLRAQHQLGKHKKIVPQNVFENPASTHTFPHVPAQFQQHTKPLPPPPADSFKQYIQTPISKHQTQHPSQTQTQQPQQFQQQPQQFQQQPQQPQQFQQQPQQQPQQPQQFQQPKKPQQQQEQPPQTSLIDFGDSIDSTPISISVEEGTTSLSSILDEKSLFDYQNEEMPRQKGTEARNSNHSDAYVAKRNAINQKVRSLSSDRSTVTTPRGTGHESMVQTSLPIKPSFELEEIDEGDIMNEIPAAAPKKKLSIVERAQEMAKLRD